MLKGCRPGMEIRTELLRVIAEREIPAKEALSLVSQMNGKTDAEKEQIAEEILKSLQAKPDDKASDLL